MTDQTTGTVDPTTTNQDPAAGGNSGQPSKGDSKDWEASYKGLQGAYQKLQNSTTSQVADLEKKLAEANQKIEELSQGVTSKDKQMEVLVKQANDLQERINSAQGDAAEKEKKLSRLSLVLKDFPELAQWEAEGLLPGGDTEEQMRDNFSKFKATLDSQVGAGVTRTMQGASPPGGPQIPQTSLGGESQESREYILAQMMRHAGKNSEEFNKWQSKLDALPPG